MDPIDAPRTVFMSNHDNYYYNIVPFRLKNVDATYERLMDPMFSKTKGHNLEVYIDDMIMKTLEGESCSKLGGYLGISQEIQHAPEFAKCSFGEKEGMLLGFMLTKET